MHVRCSVDDATTPDAFDAHLRAMFARKKDVVLHIDATRCGRLRFKTIMRMMPVIDKHRESSRKYLKKTTITVPNPWIARVIRFALPFVRPDQPVFVNTLSKI